MSPRFKDRFTFDLFEGEQRKETGIALAVTSREELLEIARTTAYTIASQRNIATADDVFRSMAGSGYDPTLLGNAAGAIFRGKVFEFTGTWRKSARVSNHGRVNRLWRLKAPKP